MIHTESLSLESFPTELAQAILSFAPDATSLKALTLSNLFFYRAFHAAQNLILKKVVWNEFRPNILPDALITLTSARFSLQSDSQRRDDQIQGFLLDFHPVATLPDTWSLSDFLALSKAYGYVKYFATDFASTISASPLTGASDEVPTALTPNEMDCIERAFYRYELYCNLFGKNNTLGRLDFRVQRQMFFDKFAPWENEQLATVYEYLFRKLSTAFNDVAEHDVEWGEWTVPFQNDDHPLDNHYKEYCLSLGLEYLHRLATANTYDERYKLLSPELKFDSKFLYSALSEPSYDDDEILIGNLTKEDRDRVLKPPFIKNLDIGPAEAWRWAYQGETAAYTYFQPEQHQLRKHGYVMFDFDRLCRWNILSKPFKPADRSNPEERVLTALRTDQMRKSWNARSKIWQRGGRGWWSENDQSKLVWPFRK